MHDAESSFRVAYQYLTHARGKHPVRGTARVVYHHTITIFHRTQDIIYKYFSINSLTFPKSNASTLFPFPSIVSAIHTAL